MALTKQDVKKVAKLANLPISEQEEEIYTQQLSKILGYVEQLSTVDTKDVKPTFSTVDDITRLRYEDSAVDSLSQDQALKNASLSKNGYFVTKGVFEDE